jgi:hypothetical protein
VTCWLDLSSPEGKHDRTFGVWVSMLLRLDRKPPVRAALLGDGCETHLTLSRECTLSRGHQRVVDLSAFYDDGFAVVGALLDPFVRAHKWRVSLARGW